MENEKILAVIPQKKVHKTGKNKYNISNMSSEEYVITIDGFECGLQMYLDSFIGQVLSMGYSEDEIVAVDPQEDCVSFHMSDGKIINIKNKPLMAVAKKADA